MGLGPPVCEKCKVQGAFDIDGTDMNMNVSRWYCPICGNEHMQWSAWDCGISREELEGNLQFLMFMRGPQDGQGTEETDVKRETTAGQG